MRQVSLLLAIVVLLGCFSGCQKAYRCDCTTATPGTSLQNPAQTDPLITTDPTPSTTVQPDDVLPDLSQDKKMIIELLWKCSTLRGSTEASATFRDMTPDVGRPLNGIRYYGTYELEYHNTRYAYDILYIPTPNFDVTSVTSLNGYRFFSRCAFRLYAFRYTTDAERENRYVEFIPLRAFHNADSEEVKTMFAEIYELHKVYETAIYGYSLGMLPEIFEGDEHERILSVWLTCTSKILYESQFEKRYYGNFDGYDIFEHPSHLYQYIGSTSQTIGAYTFTETRTFIDILGDERLEHFELFAIKNGELKTLKEIYDTGYGYISDESLAQIYEIFQQRRNENSES